MNIPIQAGKAQDLKYGLAFNAVDIDSFHGPGPVVLTNHIIIPAGNSSSPWPTMMLGGQPAPYIGTTVTVNPAKLGFGELYWERVLRDGAVGYWRLGEASGLVAYDLAPTPHNGTIPGSGVTYGAAGAVADGDTALTLDGADATYISVSYALGAVSAITIEGWINPSTLVLPNNYRMCVGCVGALGSYLAIHGSGTGYHYASLVIAGTQRTVGDTYVSQVGRWDHVVVTWASGDYLRLYVNGAERNISAVTYAGTADLGTALRLGGWTITPNWNFAGGLDEVAFYPTALTAEQIAAHYGLRLAAHGGSVPVILNPLTVIPNERSNRTGLALSGQPAYKAVTKIGNFFIDNHDGFGFRNYTSFLYQMGDFSDARLNEPVLLDVSVVHYSSGAAGWEGPTRGGRVRFWDDRFLSRDPRVEDGLVFTGYITNEPKATWLGKSDAGYEMWTYALSCTSDDYLANVHPLVPRVYINRTRGFILKDQLAAMGLEGAMSSFETRFDTAGIQDGGTERLYQIDTKKTWTQMAADFAAADDYVYQVIDGLVFYGPAPQETLEGISIEITDPRFNPDNIKLNRINNSIVNDLTVVGLDEPTTLVQEHWISDGYKGDHPLAYVPFGVLEQKVIDDDFTGSDIDAGLWIEHDDEAENYIQAFEGALNVIGGSGTYGDAYLISRKGVEITGVLETRDGELYFPPDPTGEAILGGFYETDTPDSVLPWCGWKLDCAAGTLTPIGPYGVEASAHFHFEAAYHHYVLRRIIRTETSPRVADRVGVTEPVDQTLGCVITWMLDDVDISDPAKVVTTHKTLLTQVYGGAMPAFLLYAPVVSKDAHFVLNFVNVRRPSQVEVRVSESGLAPVVQQVGNHLDGGRCTIVEETNGAKLAWYSEPGALPSRNYLLDPPDPGDAPPVTTIPPSGALCQISYRRNDRSRARVLGSTSIVAEAALFGDDGVRAKVLSADEIAPSPRTTEECLLVARAYLADNQMPRWEGSYSFVTFSQDYGPNSSYEWPALMKWPRPGDKIQCTLDLVDGEIDQLLSITNVKSSCLGLYLGKPVYRFELEFGPVNRFEEAQRELLRRRHTSLTEDLAIATIDAWIDETIDGIVVPDDATCTVQGFFNNDLGLSGAGVIVMMGDGTKPADVTGYEIRATDSGWGQEGYIAREPCPSTTVFTLVRTRRDQRWFIKPFTAIEPRFGDESLVNVGFSGVDHEGWEHFGDFEIAGGLATYAYSSGAGRIKQSWEDLIFKSNALYRFTYTVSGATGAPFVVIAGKDNLYPGLASQDVVLPISNGEHFVDFRAVNNEEGPSYVPDFVISVTSGEATSFSLDNVLLQEITYSGSITYSQRANLVHVTCPISNAYAITGVTGEIGPDVCTVRVPIPRDPDFAGIRIQLDNSSGAILYEGDGVDAVVLPVGTTTTVGNGQIVVGVPNPDHLRSMTVYVVHYNVSRMLGTPHTEVISQPANGVSNVRETAPGRWAWDCDYEPTTFTLVMTYDIVGFEINPISVPGARPGPGYGWSYFFGNVGVHGALTVYPVDDWGVGTGVGGGSDSGDTDVPAKPGISVVPGNGVAEIPVPSGVFQVIVGWWAGNLASVDYIQIQMGQFGSGNDNPGWGEDEDIDSRVSVRTYTINDLGARVQSTDPAEWDQSVSSYYIEYPSLMATFRVRIHNAHGNSEWSDQYTPIWPTGGPNDDLAPPDVPFDPDDPHFNPAIKVLGYNGDVTLGQLAGLHSELVIEDTEITLGDLADHVNLARLSGPTYGTVIKFTDGDTTPNIADGHVFICAYESPTTITNFFGGEDGKIITIIFYPKADITVNRDNAYLAGGVNMVASAYCRTTLTLVCVNDGSNLMWYEMSRAVVFDPDA